MIGQSASSNSPEPIGEHLLPAVQSGVVVACEFTSRLDGAPTAHCENIDACPFQGAKPLPLLPHFLSENQREVLTTLGIQSVKPCRLIDEMDERETELLASLKRDCESGERTLIQGWINALRDIRSLLMQQGFRAH